MVEVKDKTYVYSQSYNSSAVKLALVIDRPNCESFPFLDVKNEK